MLKKGYPNPSQNPSVQEKKKLTSLLRYGYESPNQDERIKKLKKETLLRNYKEGFKSKQITDKREKTCLLLHNVKNIMQTEKCRQNSRENCIKHIEIQSKNNEPLSRFIGNECRLCLDELQIATGTIILREKKDIGYSIDGLYGINIAIEFDEAHHFNPDGSYKESDVQRQKRLENVGYKFFRIHYLKWKENKQKIICDFKQFIGE